MTRHDDFNVHFRGALHDRIEVVYLKPQQYAVAVWLVVRIANGAVIVIRFKGVQLKNKFAILNQPLINGTSVIASAAQQALVPAAARFHIGDRNQRVSTHRQQRSAKLLESPIRIGNPGH